MVTLTCFIGSMFPCAFADDAAEQNTAEPAPMIELKSATADDVPDVQYIVTNTALMDGDDLMSEDFEDGDHTDSFTNLGWGYGSAQKTDPAVTDKQAASGSKSMEITTVPKGQIGVRFKQRLDFSGNDIYELTCKVKSSEDFEGLMHLSVFNYTKDGSKWFRTSQRLNNVANAFVPKSDEWTEFKCEILQSQTKNTDTGLVNQFHINGKSDIDYGFLYLAVEQQKTGVESKGKLYIDDVKIRKITEELEYPPMIDADDPLYWYTFGNQATLTPQVKVRPQAYPKLKGYFYDVHNNLVDTVSLTAEEFNNGFKWSPSKAGYYEYQFSLIDADGAEHPWYEWYTVFESEPKYYYRRALVFTSHDTKPMSERRKGMGGTLFPQGYDGGTDEVDLADRLGFSTLRVHWMSASRTGVYRSDGREVISKEKGVYDFDYYDKLFAHAKEYGFEDIGVTLMSVGDWANPTVDANGKVQNYKSVPLDDSVFVNQVRAAAEHFKGTVKWWEPFNEPGLPGESIFFNAQPERYMSLHKGAYKAIKEADPNAKVSYECPVGATFPVKVRELGIFDYVDEYHAHGMFGEGAGLPIEYRNIYDDNTEPLPLSNSEMHALLRRPTTADAKFILSYNEAKMAIVGIKSYLIATKAGASDNKMILFGTTGGDDIERAVYNAWINPKKPSTYDNYSPFRHLPVNCPRMAALAIWQFVDHMGTDYKYVNEYKYDGNQNMVHVKNDGKDELVMWLDFDTDKSAKLSSDITKYATKDLKITDFEFNEIDTSNLSNIVLEPDKLYYVTGIDGDAMEKTLPDGYGTASAGNKDMRFADVLYNYQMKGIGVEVDPNVKIPEAKATKNKLFDNKTFELSDDINWITDDFKWVQTSSYGKWEKDIDAKFAVYVDEDCLQVVAKVYGDVRHTCHNPSTLWWGDSLQIGIDAFNGLGLITGRNEFSFSGTNDGKTVVFKEYQPDQAGLVTEVTKSMKQVPTEGHGYYKCTFLKNAEGIMETTYYMEVPMFELAPYSYPVTDEAKKNNPLRFSLLINQNEDAKGLVPNQKYVRTGYLEWSTGIGGQKKPQYYGKIYLPTSDE